jgi:hypothetical protein
VRLCLKSKKRKERNIDINDDILCNIKFYLNSLVSGGTRERNA